VVGDGVEDEGVGCAVEAVFAELVVCGDFGVDWVGGDVWWDCGMERRVEEGDVDGIGELFGNGVDDGEGSGVVPIG